MNKFGIAKALGVVVALFFLPAGLLLLVGDTVPGGQRHAPDLIRGSIAIIVGCLGLALYALGDWKMEPHQRSFQRKFLWCLIIGIPVLIGVILLYKD